MAITVDMFPVGIGARGEKISGGASGAASPRSIARISSRRRKALMSGSWWFPEVIVLVVTFTELVSSPLKLDTLAEGAGKIPADGALNVRNDAVGIGAGGDPRGVIGA